MCEYLTRFHSLGVHCRTGPVVVIRYDLERHILAHIWTVAGARFGRPSRGPSNFEVLCVRFSQLSRKSISDLHAIIDDDDGTFALAVADAVTKHASKSREQWRLELAT
jgi:hypothetical protein